MRITFDLVPGFDGSPMSELSTFEVWSTSDDDPVLFGRLDATGTIDVPREALPERLRVQAELPDDPFCWWTGIVGVFALGTVQQIDLELEQECA